MAKEISAADVQASLDKISTELAAQGKQVSAMHSRNGVGAYILDEPAVAKSRVQFHDDGRKQLYQRQIPPDYKPFGLYKTFGDFLKKGVITHNREKNGKNPVHADEMFREFNSVAKTLQGLGESAGDVGGFSVLPEFAPQIHDRVYDNNLMTHTDQYTVSGNRMTFPRTAETSRATGSRAGGLQAYWTGEAGTITQSNPKLAETELRLKKLCVVVYLTNELIEDNAYALQQWVTRKVSQELTFMIGNSIVNGSGAGQPLGYMNSGACLQVTKDTSQVAGTITPTNIVNMYARRLNSTNPSGWCWLMHQTAEAALALMYIATGTAVGALVYLPPGGFSQSPYSTLYGMPVIPIEFAPTLGDHGDIALVNLDEYVTISKGGVTEATSTEVEFLTDQLAIRFTMRLDGRPYDETVITPFQAGATAAPTQSPFIIIADRH